MKKPLGRAKLVVIGLVCIICIISYLFIFRPMENALKKANSRNLSTRRKLSDMLQRYS